MQDNQTFEKIVKTRRNDPYNSKTPYGPRPKRDEKPWERRDKRKDFE